MPTRAIGPFAAPVTPVSAAPADYEQTPVAAPTVADTRPAPVANPQVVSVKEASSAESAPAAEGIVSSPAPSIEPATMEVPQVQATAPGGINAAQQSGSASASMEQSGAAIAAAAQPVAAQPVASPVPIPTALAPDARTARQNTAENQEAAAGSLLTAANTPEVARAASPAAQQSIIAPAVAADASAVNEAAAERVAATAADTTADGSETFTQAPPQPVAPARASGSPALTVAGNNGQVANEPAVAV